MLKRLLATPDDKGALIARISLGAVMFPHGAQKALGWFGGQGLSQTLETFSAKMGIPAPLALLAVAAEFLGSIALVLGVAGRLSAFGIGFTMLVALWMHVGNGFFMNWYGNQAGEGYEYHLLAIGLAAAIVVRGSGAFSVDRLIAQSSAAQGGES